jgi:hypothetical protein
MFCFKSLPLLFIKEYISNHKYKQLAKHEIEVMFQNDISLLPATKQLINEQMKQTEILVLYHLMTINDVPDELAQQFLQETGYIETHQNSIIKRCPSCTSLIHNLWTEELRCETCEIEICDKCLNVKYPEHTCDSTSIKLISETCKACPKCNILIEKESGGCDQMFCTQCSTTFSWITGKEAHRNETKHNPHFFEWQRKNGNGQRNPNDNPCEGYFLLKCEEKGYNIMVIIHDILQYSIETIDSIWEQDETIKEYYRIEYLTKKINFKKWKNKFRKHIVTQRRNYYVKQIIQICIETLYYIILSQASLKTDYINILFTMITEALQIIQKNHGKNINYFITLNYVFVPYAFTGRRFM